MMDVYNDFANMIRERDNPRKIGPCEGNVKSASPAVVTILGGDVVLKEGENLAMCKTAEPLEPGDKVLCIPRENQQFFYVVAKIRG